MLTNGPVVALTGVLVYLLLRRLRYGRGASLGTALAFGLATMAWPYARYLFSEPLAGLGLMACAHFVLRYHQEGDRLSPFLAGAGLGWALLVRLNNAIAVPFLGLLLLVYLYRRYGRDWQAYIAPLLLFGLPLLAALALSGWYNWVRFGNVLTTGYLPEERFATPFLQGFYGLTLSPGKGLLWYNPLLFAALAAWPAFYRRHRAEALLVAAVVLSHIAFYAPWYLWWAGHGWGPRFLVTILPFAALPLAPALEAAARRRGVAIALGTLAALSLVVQILGVAVNFNLYLEEVYARLGLYHPATLFNPAYSPLLRQWAYLRLANLDLAWARVVAGGAQQAAGALVVAFLLLLVVLLAGLALRTAWRGRLGKAPAIGLLFLLALGALCWGAACCTPTTGDVAQAADLLARMERPTEAAVLTDPLLTEAWQDAYDGHLPVWGGQFEDQMMDRTRAVWTIGRGQEEPAAARFQVGAVRLDYYPPPGRPFDLARLPVAGQERKRLGDGIELIAAQVESATARPGGGVPLALYWQALSSQGVSYTLFVQAIDEADVKAGQVDRLPCDGGCLTTTWRPGDLIGERFAVPIRADAPPGRYRLIAGMYDLATGERLPWFDAQGRPLGDALQLGWVQVLP